LKWLNFLVSGHVTWFAPPDPLLEKPAHDRRLVVNLPFETAAQQVEYTFCNKSEGYLPEMRISALIWCVTNELHRMDSSLADDDGLVYHV